MATIEATEEAILNSLFHAHTMTGRDHHTVPALPVGRALELLEKYGPPKLPTTKHAAALSISPAIG